MRSRLTTLQPIVWLALVGFGGLDPVAQAWAMPGIISICSGSGARFVELPDPGNPQKPEDCVKGCHALCQRKRMAVTDTTDAED